MVASVFDLFKIGVGPSSSHTMGPMIAAADFVDRLHTAGKLEATARVDAALYGSLALTGKGHATDRAVLLGLAGNIPAEIDPDDAEAQVSAIRGDGAHVSWAAPTPSPSTKPATCAFFSANGSISIATR